MSFIDWIKELLKNDNREIVKIQGKDLTKTLGTTDKFCCAVYTQKKTLLTGVPVVFKVNGVEYERKTDSTGLACLSINLGVGSYSITSTFKGDEQYTDASTTNIIKVAPVLTASDLSMSYHDGSSFEVKATDSNGNPVPNINVEITINNVTYKRLTNENGVASLRINLQAGTYNVTSSCNGNSITNTVKVNKASTRMEGTDINKVVGDSTGYQCAVYTPENNRVMSGNVDITVNGKTYTKSIDSEGLAKLNINLAKGEYTIKAEYKGDNNYTGSSVSNSCKITEPAPAPTKLYEYLTNTGCSGMGQCTPYYCACNSLQEAFYRLTGIHIAESTIASVASTTTSGTDHWGKIGRAHV